MMSAPAIAENRLRQIAILVASVDATAARQLLLHLPTATAKQVRAMAAQLGEISPEEKRSILAEFQKTAATTRGAVAETGNSGEHQSREQGSSSRPVASQQMASSPQSRGEQEFTSEARSRSHFSGDANSNVSGQEDDLEYPNQQWHDPNDDEHENWINLDVEALLRFLQTERITVVAVVISQLEPRKAVAVLERLPVATTEDVLQRLSRLQEIDPEAMEAIDDHLSQRLKEYHHSIKGELENARRLKALMRVAPDALRNRWSRIISGEPGEMLTNTQAPLVANASREQAVQPTTPSTTPVSATTTSPTVADLYRDSEILTSNMQPLGSASPIEQQGRVGVPSFGPTESMPSGMDDERRQERADVLQFPQANNEVSSSTGNSNDSQDHKNTEHIDRTFLALEFERILRLPPQQLAILLSSVDSRTVLLALAGSTPSFMKRFLRMLEPSDAKVLNTRLQTLGTLNLRDIDEAQRILVEHSQSLLPAARLAA